MQRFILASHTIASKVERHIGEACHAHGLFQLFSVLPEALELNRLDLDACEPAMMADTELPPDMAAQRCLGSFHSRQPLLRQLDAVLDA